MEIADRSHALVRQGLPNIFSFMIFFNSFVLLRQ